jgi:hypothetical protein
MQKKTFKRLSFGANAGNPRHSCVDEKRVNPRLFSINEKIRAALRSYMSTDPLSVEVGARSIGASVLMFIFFIFILIPASGLRGVVAHSLLRLEPAALVRRCLPLTSVISAYLSILHIAGP